MFLGLAYSTWWSIGMFVASMVISYILRPRVDSAEMTPGEIDTPKATEGQAIPVLFGTRNIKNMNVVWFGDVGTRAIRK